MALLVVAASGSWGPNGTDLSVHTRADLHFVEQQIDDRPHARLDYAPSEKS